MFRIKESLLYGNGAALWRDEWDWKSEGINAARVIVPRNTRSVEGSVEFCLIRDEISPTFLADLIDNSEYAKKEGWDIAEIKNTLKQKYFQKGTPNKDWDEYRTSQWESIEQRNKNLSWIMPATAEFEPVACVHLLVEELDDHRVSHYIIYEDSTTRNSYLFEADRQYDSMRHAIHFLLFSIGDGYYRSVRGLATDVYSTTDIQNRITNTMLDGAMLSAGLLLKADSAVSSEKLRIIKKGPVTIIPSGMDALQSTFQPPLDAILSVRRVIESIQNGVIGLYKNFTENNGVARTAKEVQIEQENEQRFSSTQNAWFYNQWESWLRETFRRIINPDYPESAPNYKDHVSFVVRCITGGVPAELMMQPGVWELTATRNIGYGSPSQRMSISHDLISIAGMLDEEGRRAVIQEYVASRVPHEDVSRFVAEINRNEVPNLDYQMAESESADMSAGTPRTVASGDFHLTHIMEHARFLNELVDGALQGQKDSLTVAQMIPIFIQHIQQHLQYMSQDPTKKEDMKKAEEIVKQLMEKAQPVMQQAEEIKKQQEKQMQEQQDKLAEAEEIIKNKDAEIEKYKIDRMSEVEMYKAEQLDKSRQVKTETSSQAMMTKLQSSIQNNIEKLRSDIALDTARTRAEIETKLQKSLADLQAKAIKSVGGRSNEEKKKD
jgi:hypothetical protein